MWSVALSVALVAFSPPQASPIPPSTDLDAVYALVERLVPGASAHFDLSLSSVAAAVPGFVIGPGTKSDHVAAISATGASELASGVGYYLREIANATIGWPRGGGSRVPTPSAWPKVTVRIARERAVPISYIMNVCTHSYSLVWYSWAEWEAFIDWMALSGINMFLALTGQEEVQYKVFEQFGLVDDEVRTWFNGPAFLTWSRGQNEYGAGIAGPLPRSFMKSQWELQRQILKRARALGLVGQLPAFQGNVPIALKDKQADANITKAGATGWMDALDPLYGKIADVWMKQLLDDFGTDHWYQLDGYFNGGTAPWLAARAQSGRAETVCCCSGIVMPTTQCYDAPAQCNFTSTCGGRAPELAAAAAPAARDIKADPSWKARGAAAYAGLSRTDPEAVWSFQGWAFVGWDGDEKASWLRGFVEAVPQDHFVVMDMSVNGDGEWKKWGDAAYWGAKYVWTTLHDFGGTDGMKGNVSRVNQIPWQAIEAGAAPWGTGFTPEGIDQNPAYYEFVLSRNWASAREPDLVGSLVERAHRRYGLTAPNADVAAAWKLLVGSAYAQDLSVQDQTGIPHLPGSQAWSFAPDRHTPTPTMCDIYRAWAPLRRAAAAVRDANGGALVEPFSYDLVNLGREILAQLSTPLSMNFSSALGAKALDPAALNGAAAPYLELLSDVDQLLGTDSAFLLGPWLRMARAVGGPGDAGDCVGTGIDTIKSCADFYEWNARVQLTTWNPTRATDAKIPGGPIDYASKHWSGLVRDYYRERAAIVLKQALADANAGGALNQTAIDRLEAQHAFAWTTAQNAYAEEPSGSVEAISEALAQKYASRFAACK